MKKHIYALLDLCKKENFPGDRVFLHLARDGRDNPNDAALGDFTEIEKECQKRKIGQIASIFGRYLLDRGKIWERTEKLYNLLTDENQNFITDWKAYIKKDYQNKIWDENSKAIAIGNENGILPRVSENDVVINFNYRADRERQITATFEKNFKKFKRKKTFQNVYYVGFIAYASNLKDAHHAFDEEQVDLCLAEILEKNGYHQLHIAGKEKVIFVTYNFNRSKNKEELHLDHEENETAPQTKKVETFDKNPEMSAPNLTKILLKHLEKDEYDMYVVNYENCDQVGHTGNLDATIKAVEAVDHSLSQIIPKALKKGFEILITADHGNADIMVDEQGRPHTAHTHNKVPCIYVSEKNKNTKIRDGFLYDIAPTILDLLNIKKPKVMIGTSLIE
jgi:2,3-bisphosphoglycerate-independent phosphoglycerate mutase